MSFIWPEGVNGGSKWRVSTIETKVRMNGVEVALGNRGMTVEATMRARSERVESPGTYVTECVSRGHFCLVLCSF